MNVVNKLKWMQLYQECMPSNVFMKDVSTSKVGVIIAVRMQLKQ